MKKTLSIIIAMLTLLLVGCSNYVYVDEKLNVVTTTTMLADLVNQIGKDKVSVTPLMGVGVDPHLYTPKAKDTIALFKSDLVVYNGLHLEGKMVDILDTLSNDKPVLNIGNYIIERGYLLPDEDTLYDPHIWFDVRNWIIAADEVRNMLIDLDEINQDYYNDNANNYIILLEDLHEWIINEVETKLTKEERILVTAHDAFSYFGNAYDFKVLSIQGISTVTEASIKDINNIINIVISKNVAAIFVESSVSNATILQVLNGAKAKGHEVILGALLYSDSLGNGSHSEYINAFKFNVTSIINGLKGENGNE